MPQLAALGLHAEGVCSALVLSARCRAEPVEEEPKNQLADVIRWNACYVLLLVM
jgi:hypothetical protein